MTISEANHAEATAKVEAWKAGPLASDYERVAPRREEYSTLSGAPINDIYTEADVTRLQNVVVYRRLGLPLDAIADLLTDGTALVDHLRRQRATVMSRLDEMHHLVTAIDRALEREMNGVNLSKAEQRELFGAFFLFLVKQGIFYGDRDVTRNRLQNIQILAREKRAVAGSAQTDDGEFSVHG